MEPEPFKLSLYPPPSNFPPLPAAFPPLLFPTQPFDFSGLLHAQLQYLSYLQLLQTPLSPAKPEPTRIPEPPLKEEPLEEPRDGRPSPTPSAAPSAGSVASGSFQEGVTVGYTYDALFISDGRSKRRATGTKKGPERYQCPQCQKSYATSSNLSRHKQTHRPIDSDLAKACPYGCGKIYVSMPALSMHILTHKLEHKCGECGKAFSRPWLLQGHMRSHSGLKPFGCAHCGKAFSDRSNLRAHMQTHSGEKKYDCGGCGKSFALKSYLNKHGETCLSKSPSLLSPALPFTSNLLHSPIPITVADEPMSPVENEAPKEQSPTP